ncbi:hypothetical protein C8R46DRAFT_1341953 [Mycena filopes]|nr:hypothetical protein C8R46DRAFT_1341953 [Mycena filopes]
MFSSVQDVYYPPSCDRSGASFTLYEPTRMPDLPPVNVDRVRDVISPEDAAANGMDLDELLHTSSFWPDLPLDAAAKSAMSKPENVLQKCYENDVPYDAQSPAMTITLEAPLSTGTRERPAQVWRVSATGCTTPLVARIYDPLYFTTVDEDRFKLIERAVACENEAYARLQHLQGSGRVPTFRNVLVAEVPGDIPRHVYVVLLEYMPGIDLRTRMRTAGATTTCSRHKAGIFNAVARASYPVYRLGVQLDDLMDRNVILREPQQPSQESFCASIDCPFRHTLHIDLGNAVTDEHQYAPRLAIIDLEDVRFYTTEYDIETCRASIANEWKVYCDWLSRKDIDNAFSSN